MSASRHSTPRFAVVECPTYSQAWDSASFICSFDMPNEVEYRGNFRACFRFIMRQESQFDFLIVYLKADDSFNDDDIVWRPLDRGYEDLPRLINYSRSLPLWAD